MGAGRIIVQGVQTPVGIRSLALLAASLAWIGLLAGWDSSRATAAVDFSGHWILVSASPVRPGYEQFWLGTEILITQAPASVSMKRLNPLPQRDARFTLDGSESRNEYVVKGQRQIKDSRATWNGDSLLISTDTTLPDGQRSAP